jgi:hypothetical protein
MAILLEVKAFFSLFKEKILLVKSDNVTSVIYVNLLRKRFNSLYTLAREL